jgi:hypothetical protein
MEYRLVRGGAVAVSAGRERLQQKQGVQDFSYEAFFKPANPRIVYYTNAWSGDGEIRSTPYTIGAHGSVMGRALLKTHRDRLTPEEFRRVIVWLDGNAQQLSTWFNQEEQKAGQVVWHPIEVDPANPLGIEFDRPLPAVPGAQNTHQAMNAQKDNP